MTKRFKETSRAIKPLTQRAKKGNFESSFQLYKNYTDGKNVPQKDDDLASKFFSEVENALIEKTLHLESLQLSDFRRFRTLNITFNKKMTVIIGNNGAGKTSIAEAIAKIFTWFNNNLEKTDVNGRPVVPSDIHVDSSEYGAVSSTFKFDRNNTFDATLGKGVPGYTGSSPTEVTVIKQFASMYQHTAKNSSIMIPLLAFYSVDRSDFKLMQTVSEKASDNTASNRFSDIKTALEGSGKLEDFSSLYIELVNLAEGENTKEVKELREQISTLQKTIDEVYEGKNPPENDLFSAKLDTKKEDLTSLLQSMSSAKYQRHLDFVNSAIEKLVPDVKNLEVDRSSGKPKLLVENFGNKVNISQLSQGQKMLVALTGDLARRLVKLNPEADAPLSGHGIVIIDEIELHLHPQWQQEILIGLQETFPNIQFIVTTHSPQVLSTVDNKCIRQIYLNKSGNPEVKIPKFQTKGVTSASILARIMDTDSTPTKLSEAKLVKLFYDLIANGKDSELPTLLGKITAHFGDSHPVTRECMESLKVSELKKKYMNIKG